MKFKKGEFVKVKESFNRGCGGSKCKTCMPGILTVKGDDLYENKVPIIKGEIKGIKNKSDEELENLTWCHIPEEGLEYYYAKDNKIKNWRGVFEK